MKSLFVGLLILGSFNVSAETFDGTYKDGLILKRSNSDFVCQVLSGNPQAKALRVEYIRTDKYDVGLYVMKDGKVRRKYKDSSVSQWEFEFMRMVTVIDSIDCL